MRQYNPREERHLLELIARANASNQGAVKGDFGHIEGSENFIKTDKISIADVIRRLPSDYRTRAVELLNSEYKNEFLRDIQRSDLWRVH